MSGPGAGVTVVVPVWDRYVEFLADAVESVRRNAPRAPIVVVDNASSRAVPELEGCTVVRSPRRLSVGAARNLGLHQVATEYVIFLDADDLLLDGAIEFLHRRIAADASLAVSVTSILEGETGKRHRTPRRFVPMLARWPWALALANSVWLLLPTQGCAILRTGQVRDAGGYADVDCGEDWVLAVSLAFRGRAEVSQRFGLCYRPTPGSLWPRPLQPRELWASAERFRTRLREDPYVPHLAHALLPAIAALQLVAIHLVRPVYRAARRLATSLSSNIR